MVIEMPRRPRVESGCPPVQKAGRKRHASRLPALEGGEQVFEKRHGNSFGKERRRCVLRLRSKLTSSVLAGATLSVAACGQSEALDCREAYRELDACAEKVLAGGGEFQWDQCLPYSAPLIITGLFAHDFEYNVFLEGPYADQRDPWETPLFASKLAWDHDLHKGADGKQLATVSRVTFEGRRPLCLALPDEQWIIVDRLIEEEVVQSRPSAFP